MDIESSIGKGVVSWMVLSVCMPGVIIVLRISYSRFIRTWIFRSDKNREKRSIVDVSILGERGKIISLPHNPQSTPLDAMLSVPPILLAPVLSWQYLLLEPGVFKETNNPQNNKFQNALYDNFLINLHAIMMPQRRPVYSSDDGYPWFKCTKWVTVSSNDGFTWHFALNPSWEEPAKHLSSRNTRPMLIITRIVQTAISCAYPWRKWKVRD